MVKRPIVRTTSTFRQAGELPPFKDGRVHVEKRTGRGKPGSFIQALDVVSSDGLSQTIGPSVQKGPTDISPFPDEVRSAIARSVAAELGATDHEVPYGELAERAAELAIDKVLGFQETGQIDTRGEA